MTLPPPPDPGALLSAAGLGAKKSWGQNFLRDQRVLADIARLTQASETQPVLELGAGLGALTYHLAAKGGRVLAIERDRDLAPILRNALAWAKGLEVREADAGRLDYAALAQELGGPLTVCGNLPYQLSSRILVSLADAQAAVGRAVILVQREVAERLSAGPGSRDFGLLTVLVGRRFRATLARGVPPGAFLPPPRVHSAVVLLEAHAEVRPPELDGQLVAAARAAFHSRRKTLKNSLANGLGSRGPELEEAIRAAGLDPGVRAETLDLDAFARLGAALAAASLLGSGGAKVCEPETPD